MFDFLKSRRETPVLPAGTLRIHYRIFGRVQGVGFRYRAKYAAQSLGLTGWVENLDDGSVEMEVQGTAAQMERLFPMIQTSDYIQIDHIQKQAIALNPWERSFQVKGY